MKRQSCNRYANGAALIVALLLTALGAAVAAQLIQPLAGWLTREYRARDLQASYTLADAAATWSLTVLAGDARLSTIDHLGELWAISLPPTQVEGGTIEGKITDLQARFNLNSLTGNGIRSDANMQLARQIFERAGVPVALVERLADATDADLVTIAGQSEAQAYGMSFSNQKIETLADLLNLGGFTPAHLAALAPYVDVLPDATPININTASAELLAIAFPQVRPEQFAQAMALRQSKPFTTTAELSQALGNAALSEAAFSVRTQFFQMNAQISFDLIKHTIVIRARRIYGAVPTIYYRSVQNS